MWADPFYTVGAPCMWNDLATYSYNVTVTQVDTSNVRARIDGLGTYPPPGTFDTDQWTVGTGCRPGAAGLGGMTATCSGTFVAADAAHGGNAMHPMRLECETWRRTTQSCTVTYSFTLVSDPDASASPSPAPGAGGSLGDSDATCTHGVKSTGTDAGVPWTGCLWTADAADDPRMGGTAYGVNVGAAYWDWHLPVLFTGGDGHYYGGVLSASWLEKLVPLPSDTKAASVGVNVCQTGSTWGDASVSVNVSYYTAAGSRINTSVAPAYLPNDLSGCILETSHPYLAPSGAAFVQGYIIFDGAPSEYGVKDLRITTYGGTPTGTLDQTSSCFLADGTIRPDCSGIPSNPGSGCDVVGPLSGKPKVLLCPESVPVCSSPSGGIDITGWAAYLACIIVNDIPAQIVNAMVTGVNAIIDLGVPYGGEWYWHDWTTHVGTLKPFSYFAAIGASLDAAAASPAGADLPAAITLDIGGHSVVYAIPWGSISSMAAPYRGWFTAFLDLGYVVWLLKWAYALAVERSQPEQLVFGLD